MKLTDNDIKKDAEEAYSAGQAHWHQYWEQAQKCLKFVLGDQWDAKDKSYLQSMDREALVFNRAHRIRNTISGYEQKNLLSLNIEPFEGADEKTASQFSALVQGAMSNSGGYMCMSGAFEHGPVITGMNLVEPWLDHSTDLLSGDIRFRRHPYNRYILDPNFQSRNLDDDCNYIYTRDYLPKDRIVAMLPEREAELKSIKAMRAGSGSSQKFPYFYPLKGRNNEYNLSYDRFFTKTFRPYQVLVDMTTGQMVPVKNAADPKVDEILKMFLSRYGDRLKLIKGTKKGIDLHIFVEGELMYTGPELTGIDEYPFVLEAGYWSPESEDPKYRMQGVINTLIDPGTEANRRRSMILDMLDGVIRNGWKVKDGKVKNPEELYGSGFGVVVMDENADMTDAERLQAPQLPVGLFQMSEMMDKDHDDLSGVNAEMFGSPTNENMDISGILSKLRSSAGLTTLQSIFGGHRFSKAQLGRKLVNIFQKNFTPAKVQRILGEPPTQEFYTKQFGKYDCVPVEGVLTDTQRQTHYAQIRQLKMDGAPIPWNHLLDYAPIEKKDELRNAIAQAEQQQQAAMQQQMQMQQATQALLNADIQSKMANTQEKLTQAKENQAGGQLDRVKAIKELQSIDIENLSKTLNLLKTLIGQPDQITNNQPGQQGPPAGGI